MELVFLFLSCALNTYYKIPPKRATTIYINSQSHRDLQGLRGFRKLFRVKSRLDKKVAYF